MLLLLPNNEKHLGFGLLSLELLRHPILGNNKFVFQPENNDYLNNYSVIIGSNGTGKSELLKILIDMFRLMSYLGKNLNYSTPSYLFNLEYYYSGSKYSFTNFTETNTSIDLKRFEPTGMKRRYKPKLYRSSKEIEFDTLNETLPKKIISNSIMLTDKFFVPRSNDDRDNFEIYKYLGVRNRPQQASTRSYVRRTVELISKEHNNPRFIKGMQKAFEFLDLPENQSLNIVYYTSNFSKIYNGKLSIEVLDKYFHSIEEKYSKDGKTPPFKVNSYKKIRQNEKELSDLILFVNTLHSDQRAIHKHNSPTKKIIYDLFNKDSYQLLSEEYGQLDILRQLGFLKPPEIKLQLEGDFDISKTSSGEFHFFSTIVGLLAMIKPNCLILIDEPEISLHPNWQMKYLSFIRELFSEPDYYGCQFVIATHSHFLISDLKGENSNIIGLKKEDGRIQQVELRKDLNTYGWSAEEVLYKVFNVKTTRNYNLELDLRELLHKIAIKSDDKQSMQEILWRLEKIKFSKEDPINVILSRAKKYLHD